MKNDHQQQDLFEDVLQMYGSSTECEDLVLEFSSSDTQCLMKRVESYLSSGSSWYKKLKVDKDMESLDSFGINEVSEELDDDEKSDCSFANRYEESLNWEVDNYEEDDTFHQVRREKPFCKKFSPLILRKNSEEIVFLDPPQCVEASGISCSSLENKTMIVSSLFIDQPSMELDLSSSVSSASSSSFPSPSSSCNVSYSAMDSSNRVLLVQSKLDIKRESEYQRLIRLALLSSSILYIVVNKRVEDVVAHQIIFEILRISSSLKDAFKTTLSSDSSIRIPDIRVLFCRSDLVLDQGLTKSVEFLNFADNCEWDEWIDETSPIIKQIIEGSLRELESEHTLKLFSMVSNYVHDYFGNFNSIYNLMASFTNMDGCNSDMILAQTAITTARIMTKVKELATKKEIENKNTLTRIETESRAIIRKKNKEIEKLKKQLNEFKKNFYSTIDLTEKAEKKQETKIIDLSSHLIGNSKHHDSRKDHEEQNSSNYYFHPYVYVIDKFRVYDELRKSKNYRVKRYKDGSKYEGEYINHAREGLGTFLNEFGNIYTGAWQDNERQGYGMQEYSEGNKYCGQWKKDAKHGYGTSWYKDGGVFTGEYLEGLRTGKGIYTYPSGNQYDGEWKNGVRNGFGIYRYSSGEEYYGDWVDDLRSGFGTYIGADESKYEGEWSQGLKHGEGTLIIGNETYKGSFVSGKKHGKGKIVFNCAKRGEDPISYEGSFLEDEMEGDGKYFLKSGDIVNVIVSKGIVKIISREVCKFKTLLLDACSKRDQQDDRISSHFVDVIII